MCLFYLDTSQTPCLCLERIRVIITEEMASKNYNKGANFERAVKKDLEKDGWFVVRSAGSKGKADLVAINELGETLLIQCKLKGEISNIEKAELSELAQRYKAKAFIVQKDKGKSWWVAV